MTLVCDKRFVAIKKGNKLGTTLFAHNFNPFLAAMRLLLEKSINPIVNNTKITGKIMLFKETTAKVLLFFLL